MLRCDSLSFDGPYKELIIEYLRMRSLKGFTENYKYHLTSLNRFLVQDRGHDDVTITEDDVCAWVSLATSLDGKMGRFCVIDQFAAYLLSKGYEGIYRGQARQFCNGKRFEARILSDGELASFFNAADHIQRRSQDATYDHATVFPMLVRLLYGCGLRLSEATGVKTSDIDLETGAINIIEGKNGNSRIVYASDSLVRYIERYMETICALPGEGHLLRGHDGRPYANVTAEKMMRKVRRAAGLDDDGAQPLRLHDLRHNFAIRAMEKMADEGFDLYAFAPYLCEYMGHKDIKSTEYYIKLSLYSHPRVLEKMHAYASDVIPDVGEW